MRENARWPSESSAGSARWGLGPILGGALLDQFWWGAVFLINVPVMAVVVIGGLVVLPESRNPNPGGLDPIGMALSMVGVLGLLYAITEAGHTGVAHGRVGIATMIGIVGAVSALPWAVPRSPLR